jgi:regulator of replication initiation timing
MKNPKIAAGKTISFAGFTAPRVQGGTYKAVLTKGKETFTQTFKVVNDPKSAVSDSDRIKQKETTRKLFNMSEALAYTVYQIDESTKLIAQLIEKNKGFMKEGTKIKTAFETLKAKMVVTTGDNYVGSAEPQLREKLGDLYSAVASNFTAPSASQLENLDAVKQRFDDSQKEFETLKAKNEAVIKKQAEANGLDTKIKTFAEFIAE